MRAKLVNEAIKHLAPRSEEEIFSTYPKSWQEFIVKIKERFPKAKYMHGLFLFGHIRVIIRKKSYLIAYEPDKRGAGKGINIYHLVKRWQLSWDILKRVDDFQEFKEFMKL